MDFCAAFMDPGDCTINILPAFGGGGFLIRACHFLYFENITTIFLKSLSKRTQKGTVDALKRCSYLKTEKNIMYLF